MATVGISLGGAGSLSAAALKDTPRLSESITSSGSSQQSTNVAQAGDYWHVAVSGGAVWVTGAATAVKGTGYLIPDGGSLDLNATAGGKLAVIDNS